jgi:pyruvate kinase
MLCELIRAGVDVFRINTAHGSRAEHETALRDIRAASEEVGRVVGALVDLAGPKIRLGHLIEDPYECRLNAEVHFVRGDQPAC